MGNGCPEIAPGALQALAVLTDGWDAAGALLRRYEREWGGAPWRPVDDAMPAVVGRAGLGWGRGLHSADLPEGPVKREGDGRAPAGVFRIGGAFGRDAPSAVPWIRLPYRQATATLRCIDDPRSRHYGRIVDMRVTACDWGSHEEMLRPDDLYRFGVVIEHNPDPAVPGAGSCIFLHRWAGPAEGTAGCTALAPGDLEAVLRWLDPRGAPVLIQLPEREYGHFRPLWGLPESPRGGNRFA